MLTQDRMLASELRAAAGKVDITPDYPVWMAGNPRDKKSEGVHDPISARALLLEDAQGPFVLVSLELLGMCDSVQKAMREAILKRAGIEIERQVIACGHIHSAPSAVEGIGPLEKEYCDWLVEKVAGLVESLGKDMVPVLAGCGSGEEHTISEYRRYWHKGGKIVMNWDDFSWEDILGPAGTPDPEVGVVRLNSTTDGQTIAVIYNHAGHPNTPPGTWYWVSGDYPACASAIIEKELGGVALFTNGAQGSVDIPAFRERDWEGVERKGSFLAREVLRVARNIRPHSDDLQVLNATRQIGIRQVDPDYLKWAQDVMAAASDKMVNIRDGVNDEIYARRAVDLAARRDEVFDFAQTGFLLGGAAFVTIPGELFVELGLRIKKLSPIQHTYIVDLVGASLGYIPPNKAISEGGYSTRPGPNRLDVHADEMIVEQSLGLLGKLRSRMP